MHICVITPDYPSPGRPVYTFVEQICQAFAKNECHVTVVAPQNIIRILSGKQKKLPIKRINKVGDNTIDIYSPLDVTCYSFPFLGKYINEISSVFLRCFIRRNIKTPDFYYGHFWRSGQRIYREAMRTNTPLYIASGESVIYMKNDSASMNTFCNYVKGVICVSTKNMNESIKNQLTTKEKCRIIPNGIDETLFFLKDKKEIRKKLGFDLNCFIIAYVGNFSERKGSARVSKAITILKDENIKSIFVRSKVEGSANEPNCPGILFKGSVDHQIVSDYLSAADVFVLPSLQEGCSNAIVEAMACGLPIISSDMEFNHDILDESNSILIDPNNIQSIAYAIRILKDNKDLRQRMSEESVKKASDLTINNRAKKIISFMLA